VGRVGLCVKIRATCSDWGDREDKPDKVRGWTENPRQSQREFGRISFSVSVPTECEGQTCCTRQKRGWHILVPLGFGATTAAPVRARSGAAAPTGWRARAGRRSRRIQQEGRASWEHDRSWHRDDHLKQRTALSQQVAGDVAGRRPNYSRCIIDRCDAAGPAGHKKGTRKFPVFNRTEPRANFVEVRLPSF
jgi:hypothetical protein